jgi:2-amino-4-hydroxy-6-hydroxymethyldihydropteridine diphosphokinase
MGAKRVYLSLGSNLGDRMEQLQSALSELGPAGIEVLRVSSFYKTEPLEFHAQPWFVNCVAEVRTSLMPVQLLKALQAIERKLGRKRTILKGPRSIDLDILIFERAVVRSPVLTIPHERLAERRFVLVPLRELNPNLRHPVTQRTVQEMLDNTPDRSQVIRIEPKR